MREIPSPLIFFLVVSIAFAVSINAAICGNNIVEAGEDCDNTTAGSCCLSNCTFATAANVYNPTLAYLLVPSTPANAYLTQTQHLLNTTAVNYPVSYQVVNATPGPTSYVPYNAPVFAYVTSNSRITFTNPFAGTYRVVIAATYCAATGASQYFTRDITSTAVSACTTGGTIGAAQVYCTMKQPTVALAASRCDCSTQQCTRGLSGSAAVGCQLAYPNCSAACADVLAAKPVNFTLLSAMLMTCGGTQRCVSPYTTGTACSCPSTCGDGILDAGEACDVPTSDPCCTNDCKNTTTPTITYPTSTTVTVPSSTTISWATVLGTGTSNFVTLPQLVSYSGLPGVTLTADATNVYTNVLFTGSITINFTVPYCSAKGIYFNFTRTAIMNSCGDIIVQPGEECDTGAAIGSCCLNTCSFVTSNNTYNPAPYFFEVATPVFTDANRYITATALGFNRSATNYNYAFEIINWTNAQYTYVPSTPPTFAWKSSGVGVPADLFQVGIYVGSYDIYMRTRSCNMTNQADYFMRRVSLPSISCDLPSGAYAYGAGLCIYSSDAGLTHPYNSTIQTSCDCSLHLCHVNIAAGTCTIVYGTGASQANACSQACNDVLVPKPVTFTMNASLYLGSSNGQFNNYDGTCLEAGGSLGCTSSSNFVTTKQTCTCNPVCGDGNLDTTEYCDAGSTNPPAGSCCTKNCSVPMTTVPTYENVVSGACNNIVSLANFDLPTTSNANFNYNWVIDSVTGIPGINATIQSLSVYFSSRFSGVVNVTFKTQFCTATNTWLYYYRTLTAMGCCGNSQVDAGEDCDSGTCCNNTICKFIPPSANKVCRASSGVCDIAESCDGTSGTCPADAVLSSSTMCRNVTGVCDVAEYCDGSAKTCPANVFATSGVCRPAVPGGCDVAESCTGGSADCPADAYRPSGFGCAGINTPCSQAVTCTGTSPTCPPVINYNSSVLCRASTGPCDPAEFCTGGNPSLCPKDDFLSPSAVCRPAVSVCDIAEFCTYGNATCPPDQFQPSGFVCRANVSICDVAETCNGITTACPSNTYAPSSTVCRAAVDVCDIQETCTGSSTTCPVDAFATSATQCRPSTGACDAPEYCIFGNSSCPTDGYYNSSVVCRTSAGGCDIPELCTGTSGTCPDDAFQINGYVCRPPADFCDAQEVCSGSSATCPADTYKQNTIVCRNQTGLCDIPEYCTGTGISCPQDFFADAGTICRAAADLCDVTETCNGTVPTCPPDSWAANGTQCRAANGICDQAEMCTGLSIACPANTYLDSTSQCRASAGACDPAEFCSGSSALCPNDQLTAQGVVCNASSGSCQSSAVCDGSTATCPSKIFYNSTVVCRSSAGTCDTPETCTGTDAACPTNAFQPSSFICSTSTGPCMPNSFCSGSSSTCTVLPYYNNTVVCRAAVGTCDIPEVCTGSAPSCPTNSMQPSGYICDVQTPVNTCKLNTTCNGLSGLCTPSYLSAGSTCHYDTNYCFTDTCVAGPGSTTVCTRGSAINYDDGVYCNGVETCNPTTGAKVSGTSVVCNDHSSCTTDSCSNALSACVFTPVANSVGSCGGGLGACTPGNYTCDGSGVTPVINCVGAVQPVPEICFNGIDDNCNGQVDEFCTGLPCNSTEDCLEGMNLTQCVTGECELGQCVPVDLDDTTPCEDGFKCTINDLCDGFGVCAGVPVVCNDQNSCTQDHCDETYGQCVFNATARIGKPCVSDNLCALSSQCNNQGQCIVETVRSCSTAPECEEAVCDPQTGNCTTVDLTGRPCDLNDPCNLNGVCAYSEGCVTAPRICDDFIPCTTDFCVVRSGDPCEHSIISGNCLIDGQCYANGDLQPTNPCLTCNTAVTASSWTPTSSPLSCDDNDLCTTNDVCFDGVCAGTPVDCSGYDTQCSESVCQRGQCVSVPMNIGENCTDGLFCTVNDVCTSSGECTGEDLNCAQYSTQCSVTYCSEEDEGCTTFNIDNYTRCYLDADVCNGQEYCMSGVCISGDPLSCVSTNVCLLASCDPVLGCVMTPRTNHACNDSNACTLGDSCGDDGNCYSGATLQNCDDNDPCTYDECDAIHGCTHTTLASCTTCSADEDCDSTACQQATCIGGQCIYNAFLVGTSCGTEDACSRNDYCTNAGTCATLVPELCDDLNVCTADSCIMGFGCIFDPLNGTVCDDGDPCTVDDQCYNGECTSSPFPCPSDTDCLEYVCQVIGGNPTCIGVPQNAGEACFTDDPCQVNGYCSVRGLCVTSNVNCPPATECIPSYTCDEGACMPEYASEGTPCNTHNLCVPSACDGLGECVLNTSDAVACPYNATATPCQREPVCIPQTGDCYPQYYADGTSCDDGNLCTAFDACHAGWCVGVEYYDCSVSAPPGDCMGPPLCDPVTGCYRNPLPDGSPCFTDDGCTTASACFGGVCVVPLMEMPCTSHVGEEACTYYYCQEGLGCQVNTGAYNGLECDMHNLCFNPGLCSDGLCDFTDTVDCADALSCDVSYCSPEIGCLLLDNNDCKECSTDDDCPYIPCKQATCGEGTCAYSADDLADAGCNDGLFCNGEEMCSKGTCILGVPPNCTDESSCTQDSCDDSLGMCVNAPLPVNTTCTPSDMCALQSRCDGSGTCVVYERMPCTFQEPCRVSEGCNPITGGCASTVLADGTPCVPNDPCAGPATCQSGMCAYSLTMNCSAYEEQFCSQLFSCNRQTGECQGYGDAPHACDDGHSCTLGDRCAVNGTCLSGEYDACEFTVYDEQCQYVVCTEDDDDNVGCAVNDYADNTTCSTGIATGPCSGDDVCLSGACTRMYAAGELCRTADDSGCDADDYCMPFNDYCLYDDKQPDGTGCDSTFYCYITGKCLEGECVGDEERDCSDYDSPCTIGVCDETSAQCTAVNAPASLGCMDPDLPCVEHSGCYYGYCLPYYAPIAVPCTDDDACTTTDHCSGVDGVCVPGAPVDCTPFESSCSTAACDSMSGECDVTAINEGVACNADSNYCTTNDTCHSGVCVAGTFLDCTYLDESCRRGICTVNATCDTEVTGRTCSPDYCSGNCTAPFEWWATHNSQQPGYGHFTWPNNLETATICGKSCYEWSQMPYEEYPWLALFQQWLGATLNVANGACLPDSTFFAMNQVEPLLDECFVHDIYFTNTTATPYRDLLATIYAYNSGVAGPGLCDPRPCFDNPAATAQCLFVAHLLS